MRLFVSTESSGPVRRIKSILPPAVVRPVISAETDSPGSDAGPGPTSHPPWALVPGCREVEPPLAPVPRFLGAAAEDGEVKFSNPMRRYRGTPRVAQQNHQVRRRWVSQSRGQA
jgi:hypothetical protein